MDKKETPKFEKYRGLFIVTMIVSTIYMAWRIIFTVPSWSDGIAAALLGVYLVSMELFGTLEVFEHYRSLSNIFVPEKPSPPAEWYPEVDVFIATYNEPPELLRKTINGCLNMDYIDKKKVHIYVCDDKRREEIKALCAAMGVRHLTRADNKDAKAGNYNNALLHSTSPLIANFDADMIPMHNFLTVTVPYFYVSPQEAAERQAKGLPAKKVGFVQTPQCFYNPDLFQYNLYSEAKIPDEQDYFFRDVQTARNKTNSVIYAGSNTVLSREALQAAGGYFTGVITEDFATGLMIQRNGYLSYAIPEIVASGLAPGDLKSLINQRKRWARGCIQTLYKLKFLFISGLTLEQRISYWTAFSYWYSSLRRLAYIISPIALAVFSVPALKCSFWEVMVFAVPAYVLQDYTLKKLSGNIRNSRWSIIYETILFPSLLPALFLETFGIRQKTFSVTRKDGGRESNRSYQRKHAIPHIIFSLLSLVGIASCLRDMFVTGSTSYIVILFWLLVNFYTTSMAVFFMLGREIKRTSERYFAAIDCELSWAGQNMQAKTADISENGFSLLLDFPHYIPDDLELDAVLRTERYESRVKFQIVNVVKTGKGYKYAARITRALDFANQNALYSIVFDRIPTLPAELSPATSLCADFVDNIRERFPRQEFLNRKLPRIPLNVVLKPVEGPSLRMLNFNYAYLLAEIAGSTPAKLTIPLAGKIRMECSFSKNNPAGLPIYHIDNFKEFAGLPGFADILKAWLKDSETVPQPVDREVIAYEFNEFSEVSNL
ncbi:MAG: glycosyltransferase [Acidaminococcales bacterium]|jgi:cellulose synthase (UDP-forming)|nr:glycosyltransferase [Acidaminococcales bacterium]